MITAIKVRNYKCLRDVSVNLGPIQILVGPNASGKTTLLDSLAFVKALLLHGLPDAIHERSQNPLDLVWRRMPACVEIQIEAAVPSPFERATALPSVTAIRYELQLGFKAGVHEPAFESERLTLLPGGRQVIWRDQATTHFFAETEDVRPAQPQLLRPVGTPFELHLATSRWSALGSFPEDLKHFPVTSWFRQLLQKGVHEVSLNSAALRRASPPGLGEGFRADGSNMPGRLHRLVDRDPHVAADWIAHVRSVFPEIESVRTVVREEDRHAYLMVRHRNGLEVPSWGLSDGCLKFLTLTLMAYDMAPEPIYLIEEPENGIHPTAIEAVYQSLSSIYAGQVMMATHSPILLSIAESKDVLCFSTSPEAGTSVVRGDQHPALAEWKGEISLGDMFASGVLS